MIGRTCALILMLIWSVSTAHAQPPHDIVPLSGPMNIEFMSGPIALDSEPVVGAPYSAEAITDVVQTLADGNRIVRQSKAQISRDGQGRTRREESLAMFGPLVNGPLGKEPRHVQISDPVAGTNTMLDPESKTAHKMPALPRMVMHNNMAVQGGVNIRKFEMAVPAPPSGNHLGGVMFQRGTIIGSPAAGGSEANKPAVEDLGTTFMEGVAVQGTRTTVTIAAGQIGNELPISIVSERWFSPDLKVLVMSRHSDPRFGETTYRLSGITRAEPSPQLFEIPADYKTVDTMGNRNILIERKVINK